MSDQKHYDEQITLEILAASFAFLLCITRSSLLALLKVLTQLLTDAPRLLWQHGDVR